MSPWVDKEFTFNPPEAHAAASVYRNAASELRSCAQQVSSVRSSLDGSWFGNAKNIFFDNSDQTANFFNTQANVLEQLAREAEKPVTVTRKVWVDEENT